MKPSIRSSIAYIAGSLILRKNFTALRDEAQGTRIAMTGSFMNDNIDVHDLESGAKVMGMSMGNNASFSHSQDNISVNMQLNGAEFKGTESAGNRSFNGSVNGMTVKLYDYDEGKYFYYGLVG